MTEVSESQVPDDRSVHALSERLERIETALAHLQHDVDALNSSLTIHFRRLQEIDDRFQRLEHEMQMAGQSPEKRDPASERPPHY